MALSLSSTATSNQNSNRRLSAGRFQIKYFTGKNA